MDHGYFKDRISAYYDNNLSLQERVIIEQHLKECEECRKFLKDLEKLDKLVAEHSQLGDDIYWEQSAKKIEQKLGFEKTTAITDVTLSRRFGFRWKLVAVAASVVFLIIVGVHRNEIWQVEQPVQNEPVKPSKTTTADTVSKPVSELKGKEERVSSEKMTTDEKVRLENITVQREKEEEAVQPPTKAPSIEYQKVSPQKAESVKSKTTVASEAFIESKADVSNASIEPVKTEEIKPDVADKESQSRALTEQVLDTTSSRKMMAQEQETISESLIKLRQQKDSLMELMVKEGRWKDKTGLVQSLTGVAKKEKPQRSPVDIESDLLQTCYKIAELTEDEKERQSMKDIIKKVAEDNESPNQALAKSYLEQLLLQK